MKEIKLRSRYTDKFLVQEGFEEVSTITITQNSYMTEDAWKEMTPNLVEGYSNMEVVLDHPNQWLIEIFDVFVVQLYNLEALKHCYDNNIISIKEEGGASHVNQTYNRLVANNDEAVQRGSLGYPH